MKIININENYWGEITNIEKSAYPKELQEYTEILQQIATSYPQTSLISVDDTNTVLGFLISHPWDKPNPPELHARIEKMDPVTTLYLNDLAISKDAKGKGVGKRLSEHLISEAKKQGYKQIKLVAVEGADSFWSKMGFTSCSDQGECSNYGDRAVKMELKL